MLIHQILTPSITPTAASTADSKYQQPSAIHQSHPRGFVTQIKIRLSHRESREECGVVNLSLIFHACPIRLFYTEFVSSQTVEFGQPLYIYLSSTPSSNSPSSNLHFQPTLPTIPTHLLNRKTEIPQITTLICRKRDLVPRLLGTNRSTLKRIVRKSVCNRIALER